jgi:ABC-type multidrug transport system ATPase subunit
MKIQGVVEDRLVLLKGVNGAFRPGVLTTLMGVSGAGKTTLMDVLAGRKTGGYIEGDIKISGYPKKQETFARIAGYCEQNDIHSPHVTVYESLLYSAWLRLPPEVDSETRRVGTHFLKFTSDIWDSVCRFGFSEFFSFQYLFPFGLLVIHSSSINLISIT